MDMSTRTSPTKYLQSTLPMRAWAISDHYISRSVRIVACMMERPASQPKTSSMSRPNDHVGSTSTTSSHQPYVVHPGTASNPIIFKTGPPLVNWLALWTYRANNFVSVCTKNVAVAQMSAHYLQCMTLVGASVFVLLRGFFLPFFAFWSLF